MASVPTRPYPFPKHGPRAGDRASGRAGERAPGAPGQAPTRSGERGIALLIVLILLLILVPFAGEFSRQVMLEVRTAQNVADQLMLENALDGQFEILLARLKHDGEGDDVDTLNDEMFDDDVKERREEETGVSLSTRVADEQGKFNVLMLIKAPQGERRQAMHDRMVRILIEARRDTRHAIDESLAKQLVDEASSFLSGAKARGNIPKPQTPDNRGFLMLEDLAFSNTKWRSILVDQREGDEVAPGLHRYLTIYGTGKVNLNTAEAVVLRAYFPSDPSIGDKIVEHREGTPEDETNPTGTGTGTTGTGTTGTGTTGTGTTGTGTTNNSNFDEEQAGNPFTDVNQVNTLEGVDPLLLQKDKVDLAADFDVKSHFWSMRILAESLQTRREELYVVERVKQATQQGTQQQAKVEGFRHHLHEERIDVLEDIGPDRR
jgi:type II secretory pathway component PulK